MISILIVAVRIADWAMILFSFLYYLFLAIALTFARGEDTIGLEFLVAGILFILTMTLAISSLIRLEKAEPFFDQLTQRIDPRGQRQLMAACTLCAFTYALAAFAGIAGLILEG